MTAGLPAFRPASPLTQIGGRPWDFTECFDLAGKFSSDSHSWEATEEPRARAPMSLAEMSLANLGSRIDLRKASILLVEPNNQAMDVLTSIFLGFGATHCLKASSFEEAQQIAHSAPLDLIACEATLQPDQPDGYEFVHWLRRSNLEPNAFAPVVLISSHTSNRNVSRARDCGAHFMITKPLAPTVLLQRILWIAQNNRTFVECASYKGPDRRFQNLGPPDGVGRRHNDLSAELGDAVERNMDQDEIDNLLSPKKVVR